MKFNKFYLEEGYVEETMKYLDFATWKDVVKGWGFRTGFINVWKTSEDDCNIVNAAIVYEGCKEFLNDYTVSTHGNKVEIRFAIDNELYILWLFQDTDDDITIDAMRKLICRINNRTDDTQEIMDQVQNLFGDNK